MSEDKAFPSRKSYQPGLVFQPKVHQNIGRGIDKLVAAIRPTLGPTPRTVAVSHVHNEQKTPDVLDSGGIIARRVIEMGARDEDMGAMLARALICRQHEKYRRWQRNRCGSAGRVICRRRSLSGGRWQCHALAPLSGAGAKAGAGRLG